MNKKKFHIWQRLLLLFTLLIIIFSYSLQVFKGLEPCPLCLMQRACAFALCFFLAISVFASTLKIASRLIWIQAFFALAGFLFALRQLWIHWYPPNEPAACLPNLSLLIKFFPWQKIIPLFLWGTADCAAEAWSFLGLTIPGWSAIFFFVSLLSLMVMQFYLYKTRAEIFAKPHIVIK